MKKIELKDRSGCVFGSFRYDPSCPALYRARARAARDVLDREVIQALNQISIQLDGAATSPEFAPVIDMAEMTIYRWLDTLLGYDGAGRSIFKTIRPFASVGGRFFCNSVVPRVAETVTQSHPETFWGNFEKLIRRNKNEQKR